MLKFEAVEVKGLGGLELKFEKAREVQMLYVASSIN